MPIAISYGVNSDSDPLAQNTNSDDRSQLGVSLAISGLAIAIAYLAIVGIDNLPIQIANPSWLINAIVSIVDNGLYGLLALLLITAARLADPQQQRLRRLWRTCSRWAVLISLGFLLLIPALLLATRQSEAQVFTANAQRIEIVRRRLDNFRLRLSAARTSQEIAVLLKAEQGLVLSSDDLRRPVDSLRQALLSRLDQARSQLPNTSIARRQWRWSAWQRCLRISLMAIAYAIAFASLAQRGRTGLSFLQESSLAIHYGTLALLAGLQLQAAKRASARKLRDEIRISRQRHEQRLIQDEQDRLMAETFEQKDELGFHRERQQDPDDH